MTKPDISFLSQKLFQVIAECAEKLGFPAYVVGGLVRDLVLEKPSKKDIDIVCVGSGMLLCEEAMLCILSR